MNTKSNLLCLASFHKFTGLTWSNKNGWTKKCLRCGKTVQSGPPTSTCRIEKIHRN